MTNVDTYATSGAECEVASCQTGWKVSSDALSCEALCTDNLLSDPLSLSLSLARALSVSLGMSQREGEGERERGERGEEGERAREREEEEDEGGRK